MGSEQNRFPQQERRKRWGGCFGALSCFGSQKGGKRIVPASRIPEGNSSAAVANGVQAVGLTNQPTPSLLAPPSSPASFSNSALPSTVQSPSCFSSANSPGNTMFATGPYAHETQLVSPPVFSTFTTEPSTAPLTPPPELAHFTTPSSPDVPFAQFLTSSMDPASYVLYPGSPLRSPISRNSRDSSFPDPEFPLQWDPSVSPQNGKYSRSASKRLYGHQTPPASAASQDSNFFCPATFAEFYLDHNPPFPHNGGRLSVSKDSDVYPATGNVHQNRQNRSPKQDAEEIEAYRASFGFSADEIITTTQYVEISDVMEDSFTMTPFPSSKPPTDDNSEDQLMRGDQTAQRTSTIFASKSYEGELPISCDGHEDPKTKRNPVNFCGSSAPDNQIWSDDDMFLKMGSSKSIRKHHLGLSSSDAEIDYRRVRSLREGKGYQALLD